MVKFNNNRYISPFLNKYSKIFIVLVLSVFILTIVHCSGISKKTNTANQNVWKDKIRLAWQNLPKTKSQCTDFDYFPNGGIQSFYCHLKDISNLPEVEKYFGEPIFLKGPHKDGFLILDSRLSFGHYNPEFPKFLKRTMIPGSKDRAFRVLSQPIYDEYIKDLARVYYATYHKLHSNRVYLIKERVRYLNLIEKQTLEPYYYEKYYSFLEPGFTDDENKNVSSRFSIYPGDEQFDGNVVKSSVLFWIRRSIDRTDRDFYDGLKLLLLTYDAEFLKTR